MGQSSIADFAAPSKVARTSTTAALESGDATKDGNVPTATAHAGGDGSRADAAAPTPDHASGPATDDGEGVDGSTGVCDAGADGAAGTSVDSGDGGVDAVGAGDVLARAGSSAVCGPGADILEHTSANGEEGLSGDGFPAGSSSPPTPPPTAEERLALARGIVTPLGLDMLGDSDDASLVSKSCPASPAGIDENADGILRGADIEVAPTEEAEEQDREEDKAPRATRSWFSLGAIRFPHIRL